MYVSYKTQKIILPENKMHASLDNRSMHVWMADVQISWGAIRNMTLSSLYGQNVWQSIHFLHLFLMQIF